MSDINIVVEPPPAYTLAVGAAQGPSGPPGEQGAEGAQGPQGEPGDVSGLAAVASSGAYGDLSGLPTLGTAAALDVPASGDATTGQVVKGTDSRLSDARAPTTHAHPISDVTGLQTALDAKAASSSLAAVATSGAYSDLSGRPALATVATSGAYSDLSGKPTLGTAAALNVPASGDAAAGEVVKGTDTRLSDARTPTAHTHPISDVTGLQTALDAKAASSSLAAVATSGAYSDLSGRPSLATVATSGAYSDLSGRPTLGTAAALDVPASGDATTGQVVKGTDTRLGDVRTHNSAVNLVLSSTKSLYCHNQADETTNYERFACSWSGGVCTIGTEKGGSGTDHNLVVKAGASCTLTMSSGGSLTLSGAQATGAGPIVTMQNGVTMTSTSNVQVVATITFTCNQTSGNGGATGLKINGTKTAVGSSGMKLLHLQTSSSDRFFVDDAGKVSMQGTLTAAGTTTTQTINKPCGSVNAAAGVTSVQVNNSLVTANSLVRAWLMSNDTTARVNATVPGAGSFTVFLTGPTAEAKIGFQVLEAV
jgi:hypothetical protein